MKLPYRSRSAFTLAELIVVMTIIVILISLTAPAITSMQRSKDATTAAYEFLDAIEQARTYAIANNTYTFLGITEVDGTKSVTTTPQLYNLGDGKLSLGRVAIAVVATKDGTLGCSNINDVANSWPADYMVYKGSNLTVVRKLQVFDNMHIAATLSPPPATGPMVRPGIKSSQRLGNVSGAPYASTSSDGYYKATLNTFSWPLGTDYGKGQFNFERVITFDPQGVPYIYNQSHPTVQGWFEIGLQQVRGNAVPTPPPNAATGNQVALVISGTMGTSRIYRP